MAASAFFRDAAGRVLLVDPVYKEPWDLPGGVLSAEDAAAIRLADGELARFAFVGRDEVAGLVTPLLSRRLAACLDAAEAGSVAALENGRLWPG